MEQNERLETWKEIAGFLGVSTRTAQKLEQEQGLPVHRLMARGTVFAFTAEISEWMESRSKGEPTTELETHSPSSNSSTRWKLAGASLAVLAVSVFTGFYFWPASHQLTSCPIDNGVVVGLDTSEQALWSIPFPEADSAW